MTAIAPRLCKIAGCPDLEVDQRGRYAKLCQTHKDAQREAYEADLNAEVTEEQRTVLLAYITEHRSCSVREACEHAGVHRRAIRKLRKDDADFDADYFEARGFTPEAILAEMRRRAIDGVEEPVFHDGEIVGTITRYSDRLLTQLAKGFVPELRERFEVTGRDGGGLEVTVEHDFGAILAGLEAVGLIVPGRGEPAAAIDAAPLELLPARTD